MPRRLVHLPDKRREHEPTETRQEGEEAESKHAECQEEGVQHDGFGLLAILVIGASGDFQAPPQDQHPDEPDGAGRSAVHDPSRLLLEPGTEPSLAPLRHRASTPRKQHEVPPTEVQHLQPEAELEVVGQTQTDGIEAPRGAERRACGELLVFGRADVASGFPTRMQCAEGYLAGMILVAWLLVVADCAREHKKGAIGVFVDVAERPILAGLEEIEPQAPDVEPMPDAAEIVEEKCQDKAREEAYANKGLPKFPVERKVREKQGLAS
mmetsp:Transcript_120755/g.341491  ORF Transcript_120755/g.341491 Transcript_120755/m.341491 type:complete len:267 (-) Transcript_120755:208-1008(-)